jgi:uncharacterized oxidoreductase
MVKIFSFPQERWLELGTKMLVAAGSSEEDARTITEVLIFGSMRGIDSHGVRVLPYFAKEREVGPMRVVREMPSTALLDAGNRYGPVSTKRSVEIATEKAKRTGIGACSVFNGDWITNLSYFSTMPLEQDMIGIVLAREGPVCAPWGGTMPVTGTNPLSVAIPAGKAYPIVLDFATTVVSQGQVKSTLLQDRAIPEGWLIDRRGKSVKGYDLTLEEFEAFWNEKRGSLLPFGTYKGYGINVAIDVLCGALNLTGTGARAKGQGVLSLVINVGAFNPARDFKDEVDHLIDEIKSSPVRPGYDEVLLPGEREFRVLERRRKEGLPVDEKSWQEIKDTCSDLGVEPDHIMQGT